MIEENLEGFACNRFPKGFLRKFGNFQWIHKVKWHFHYGLVSQIDWGLVYSSNDVNVAVSHFNSKLHESIDIHAPFIEKIVKGRECKWLNADIKSVMNSMNSRNQLHRKIHKKKKAQKSRKRVDEILLKRIRRTRKVLEFYKSCFLRNRVAYTPALA